MAGLHFRSELAKVRRMTDPEETILAALQYRTEKTGGSGCLSTTLILTGALGTLLAIFSFVPLLLLTLPMVVIGWACDTKTRGIHFCGNCGNEVAQTSKLCPHCRAELVDE